MNEILSKSSNGQEKIIEGRKGARSMGKGAKTATIAPNHHLYHGFIFFIIESREVESPPFFWSFFAVM